MLAAVACSDSPTEPEPAPVVESVAANAHPAVPEGLKATCLVSPESTEASPTCPVVRWLGLTYWAFSHGDNRGSLTVVAYAASGEAIEQWERAGARYLWQITVDATAATVTFQGQDGATVTMGWEELRP